MKRILYETPQGTKASLRVTEECPPEVIEALKGLVLAAEKLEPCDLVNHPMQMKGIQTDQRLDHLGLGE